MNKRLREIKENAVTTKQHDFLTEIPYEDYEWLIEQAEKVKEYEDSLRTIIKLTSCDDTLDFANRTLKGKQKIDLLYRLNRM